jgi:hypothetical protein
MSQMFFFKRRSYLTSTEFESHMYCATIPTQTAIRFHLIQTLDRPTRKSSGRDGAASESRCSTACDGRTATRTDWPAASSSVAAPVAVKSFDIAVIMAYHMPYVKEVKKYGNINSIRSKKASIQSCG